MRKDGRLEEDDIGSERVVRRNGQGLFHLGRETEEAMRASNRGQHLERLVIVRQALVACKQVHMGKAQG
jgi:hypothetical protein